MQDKSVLADLFLLGQSQLVSVEQVKPGQAFLPFWMAHVKTDFSLQSELLLTTGLEFVYGVSPLLALLLALLLLSVAVSVPLNLDAIGRLVLDKTH